VSFGGRREPDSDADLAVVFKVFDLDLTRPDQPVDGIIEGPRSFEATASRATLPGTQSPSRRSFLVIAWHTRCI
jgi:hypothetical protein